MGDTTGVQVRSIAYGLRVFSRVACNSGVRGLVIMTKTCYVLLQQSLGGFKIQDVGELGVRVSRTESGIPRIIPAEARERIRAGDVRVIKLWMTLFSIYRVLEFPGKLKLSTITDPGKDIANIIPDVREFLPVF
jgi:hypothetical protein